MHDCNRVFPTFALFKYYNLTSLHYTSAGIIYRNTLISFQKLTPKQKKKIQKLHMFYINMGQQLIEGPSIIILSLYHSSFYGYKISLIMFKFS